MMRMIQTKTKTFLLTGMILCSCTLMGALPLQAQSDVDELLQKAHQAREKGLYLDAYEFYVLAAERSPENETIAREKANIRLLLLDQDLSETEADTEINFVPISAGKPFTRSGGLRGECPADTETGEFIALIPQTEIGVTQYSRPTVLFYVPQTQASELVFAFEDKKYFISLADQDGIIGIQLPSELQQGQYYEWRAALLCDEEDPSKNPVIIGELQRISAQGQLQLSEEVTQQQQLDLALTQGAWYDAVSLLAQMRRAQPEDKQLRQQWEIVLKAANLEEIVDEPLLDCCLVP